MFRINSNHFLCTGRVLGSQRVLGRSEPVFQNLWSQRHTSQEGIDVDTDPCGDNAGRLPRRLAVSFTGDSHGQRCEGDSSKQLLTSARLDSVKAIVNYQGHHYKCEYYAGGSHK